ncbi:MAG: MFS transporter [Actinomycetales bacterium]|nr:MFS transporter [Actinomycetales bacterium]
MAKLLFNRWVGLVFISMGISLVIIDGTIVNTIFPTVIKALNLTSTEVQWVQESYVLVFASLLLIWGSLADRYGRRLLLIVGVLIFIAASVWAGYSQDANAMILARIVQGIGGSMVLPTTLSLVNANFQGRERGIAFAVWGSTIGGMVAIGPVIGGWLATAFTDGWRLAFNVNAPIGLIIVIGVLLSVHESKGENKHDGIDIVGAVISFIMFGSLVFGLIEGRTYGWWNVNKQFVLGDFKWATDGVSVIPFALAVSVVTGVLFVLWESARGKRGKSVLLDLNLFKLASFRNGSIAALIISMGEFGVIFALPLWLQNVEGLNAVSSGMVILWLAGGAFVASGAAGSMSGKVSPAAAVRFGVLLELAGVIATAFAIGADAGWGWVAPGLFVYGVGVGFATAQLTGVIMIDVKPDQAGQASGSQSTARQVGSAMGIAVIGTTLFTSTDVILRGKLDALNLDSRFFSADAKQGISNAVVDSAGGAIPGLKSGLIAQSHGMLPASTAAQIQQAAGTAFSEGARWAALSAAIFLFIGLLSTLRLGSKLHSEGSHAE